jgi:hypothetical protein
MELGGWREIYIDRAMIEREPFLAWCERARRAPPAFWNRFATNPEPGSSHALQATDQNVTPNSNIRPRGRPQGSGSLALSDEPLIAEMRSMIENDRALSPSAAAARVADRASGGGTLESKIKRLAGRYSEKFSEIQR